MQNPENKSISSQGSVCGTKGIWGKDENTRDQIENLSVDLENSFRKKAFFLDLYIIEDVL